MRNRRSRDESRQLLLQVIIVSAMRKPTPFLDDADADEVDRPKVVSQQLRTISELMELMELFSMQWCPKEACRGRSLWALDRVFVHSVNDDDRFWDHFVTFLSICRTT